MAIIKTISDLLWGMPLIVLILLAGIIFTVGSKFFQIAHLKHIYMIGLWSPSEGVTFADYAYLYQLNTETWTIGEALQQIHMVSVGGMAGMMGVHFRYGANVYVADDGTLTLSATERNSVLGSSLATNDWIPAIVN